MRTTYTIPANVRIRKFPPGVAKGAGYLAAWAALRRGGRAAGKTTRAVAAAAVADKAGRGLAYH